MWNTKAMNIEDRHNQIQERSARDYVRNHGRDLPIVSEAETCAEVKPREEESSVNSEPDSLSHE